MKKKLLVIPMKGQYEQQCNAAALKDMGVPVIKSLKLKHVQKIDEWLSDKGFVEVDYPDNTAEIIEKIIADNIPMALRNGVIQAGKKLYTVKEFRTHILTKIAAQL